MVTRESGLKALHIRHHVKRNLVIPTCTFCQLPTVKNSQECLSQSKLVEFAEPDVAEADWVAVVLQVDRLARRMG